MAVSGTKASVELSTMSENIRQNLKSGFISAFFNLGPSSKVKHAVVCPGLALVLVLRSKLSRLQGFAGPCAAALRHLLSGDEC